MSQRLIYQKPIVTGKRVTKLSPLTGKLTTYFQATQNIVYAHQDIPNIPAFTQDATTKIQEQGYDAYCDTAMVIQGALTDTIQPSVWIAETQPVGQQTLIGIGQIILAILAIIYKLFPVWLVLALIYGATVIKNTFFREPTYNLPPESGHTEPVPWTDAVTWYNAHYWYVCPKDLFSVGDKSKYPTAKDVPEEEVNLFNDHCENAPDISPKEIAGWLQWIIYAVVIVGVVYVVAKVVPHLLKKKE